MEKALMVSTIYPEPRDNGKKVVLAGLLEYLIQRFGEKNITYVVCGGEPIKKNKQNKINLIHIPTPNPITQIKNVLVNAVLTKNKSIQESVIYSKNIEKKLKDILIDISPSLILYDTIRIGQFLEESKSFKSKEFIYLDDLFSIRYQKMLDIIKQKPEVDINPLGNFAKYIPNFSKVILRHNIPLKIALKLEKNLIMKRENEIVLKFESNLLISHKEVRILKGRTSQKNIFELKPLIKNDKVYPRKYNGQPTFIFLGSMNISHNEVSLISFLNNQIDEIITNIPNFKLVIIGNNIKDSINTFKEKYPENIIIKGYVKDLNEIFSKACGMIVPLVFGSGVKIKTLEALAAGLPVLSTDYGVEGIDVNNGIDCIVENDLDRFSYHITQLCNLEYNRKISMNASETFIKKYSKEVIFNSYDEIFKTKN